MRSTSAFVFVLLALCFLDLCQGSRRSKRTKTRGNDRAHCQLPPDPGSCTSKLRRWFYDPATSTCKTFVWTDCGGNENRFRSSRQCERSCKGGQSEDDATPVAKCRRLPCKGLDCRHGYERGFDDNGCQTCQCRSLPMTTTTTEVPVVQVCPQVDCPGVFCPLGMQVDDRGCLTCECISCPSLNCPSHLNCHDGYVVDEQTGCERCECRERPHPVAAETLPVTEKVVPATTEDSLPASSEATGCPLPLQCFIQCSEGFAVDAAGCELCACREDDAKAAPLGDDGGLLCRPVECDIACSGGYRTDENGCEICSCKDENEDAERMKKTKKNCPKISCSSKCATKTDKTGCDVCACNDDYVTIECDAAALVTCTLYCPGGYDRDSRGCEICDCRPLADEKSPDVVTGGVVTCAPFNDVLCAEKCERFYISYDEHGCEECVCIGDEPPEFTTPVLHEYGCPALFDCTLECPDSSLERDERGCEICMCRKPEVDDWLKETRPEVTSHEEEDGDDDAQTTAVTCPWLDCDVTCPDGYRVDAETGCPSCACVDDRQTGSSAIDATSDPHYVNRDSDLYKAEFEPQEPNPTTALYAEWSDAMFDAPTTLEAPVTEVTDPSPEPEGSSTTLATYPAEVMCSGRSCNKICINGLQRRKGEEDGEEEEEDCYICECNPEPRMEKRLVDVSIFNSRKGLCSLPTYKGPCRATLSRWHFNSQTGTCESFDYGGCRGNANNFRSKDSCVEFCSAEVNQERATRQEWVKEVLGFF